MDKFTKLLEQYHKEANTLLKGEGVGSIAFAGPTYQVEVIEKASNQHYWPFLKFNESDQVQDAFCTCNQNEGCIHLAAALLRIYQGTHSPLHRRFESSLWNAIAHLFSEHLGYESTLLHQEDGTYSVGDNERKMEIIVTKAHEKAKFHQLFYNREKETEENSLKFSNLSPEEIQKWREGRPTPSLRYLLSFWYDLAVWWMELQDEGEKPKITFTEIEGLPTLFQIFWKSHSVKIKITKNDLPQLIPTFSTVTSSLKVIKGFTQKIKAIHYNPHLVQFEITKEKQVQEKIHGTPIDGWLYVKNKGFIEQKGDAAFDHDTIPQDQIAHVLQTQKDFLSHYLVGDVIHQRSQPINYKMFFDAEWNWHFEGYLFEKGDLIDPLAAFFGSWAYLPNKGFYPINFSLFENVETQVSSYLVSAFIDEHRIWLNSQEGFKPHLAGIESQMVYQVNRDASLEFKTVRLGQVVEAHDFGQWIYTPEEGFFSKRHSRLGLNIRPGLKVFPFEVSDFIKIHREELETISQFFMGYCPIEKRGLIMTVLDDQTISITPSCVPFPHVKEGDLIFYDDFVFLSGQGFYDLPLLFRLPKIYQDKVIIHGHEIEAFLRDELASLAPHSLAIDKQLQTPRKFDLEIDYLARHPQGGLRAKVFIKTEFGKIDVIPLKEAMLKKKEFLLSAAGLIDLRHPMLIWLKNPEIDFNFETHVLSISTMEFLRLDATFNFLVTEGSTQQGMVVERFLNELRNFISHSPPNIKGLQSSLRTYQQTGLSWLWFLYQNDLSGILCDEMGLGKTHQAMALIAALYNETMKGKGNRFLVVCPTSVIYHWEEKLKTFLPHLKVHLFHGARRSLKKFPKTGLLLTSYGICRTENVLLKQIPFTLAIFDEIQIAKNAHSIVHKSLSNIDAKMRVGLTGTPIENRLRELKSLFDIVLPGYMPKEGTFKEVFIQPIEKDRDEERTALLRSLIRPFVLRRKKQEVLAELPAKTEENAICFLSKEQTELYNQILQENSSRLVSELKTEKGPVPYMHIFAVLSKLKQVCNHPALVAKDPKNYTKYKSGKWELFVELIDETRESGQKVVVFSQYLMMLDIIEEYVKERGWGFASIRGDTIDRAEEMRRFQEDPQCHVFIGSLGAAGLGIDLTAASTVFLFDRWWNAARENQAIDRVHRIGQKWPVQVFKFITKGTIEEKIDLMVQKKHKLMEEVVTSDDQDTIKTFTRQELIELFTFLPPSDEDPDQD